MTTRARIKRKATLQEIMEKAKNKEPEIMVLQPPDISFQSINTGGDTHKVTATIFNKSFSDSVAAPDDKWYAEFLIRAGNELLRG
jgi:hypothetical protein